MFDTDSLNLRKITADGITTTVMLEVSPAGFLSGLAIVGDSIVFSTMGGIAALRDAAR